MAVVEIHRPVAYVAPETSLLGPDGKQQPGSKILMPFVRTRSEARSSLNAAVEQYGKRFIQGSFETIFVSQESWDVLDMAQTQAAARADAEADEANAAAE